MRDEVLYDGGHRWVMFGRDPDKRADIIDTNQYLILSRNRALILDPGGVELFAPMLVAVSRHTSLDAVTDLFASHQDPDIISSLGLWDVAVPHAQLHAPAIWEGFIRHFGCDHIRYRAIPDEGASLDLAGVELRFIPAHYLHASANFHVYDPKAKVLMSGDVGAALEPAGSGLYVEDFEAHVRHMEYFHRRWMPSNAAKLDWIRRVRALEIHQLCPQHGRIFRGADVGRFLDWFERLEVGQALADRG